MKHFRYAAVLAGILALACTARAGDTPDAAKVRFQWGMKIPLRDGVQLGATAYLPKRAQGAAPCLFTLTPYIAQTYHDRGTYFAARGYPFLTIDVTQPEVAKDAVTRWIRERAVPLQDFPKDEASMQAVRQVVAGARVVALGEPAHGAHEPLAFRNRMLRYLVEHQGFTAIALESGLSESRRVNDFVLGGAGDAREIARRHLTWGFGEYQENVELLQWLRQHNSAATKKVRFYGIDLSGGIDGQFTTARIALDDASSYLERAGAEASRRARDGVAPFADRFTRDGYNGLSSSDRAQLLRAIDDVIAVFDRERGQLIAASSENEFEWARRNAVVARQIEELFRLWPADTPVDGVSAQFYHAAAARDAAMADNVRWALQREGPSGRMLVYAHNAHVMNATLRGGIWSVYPESPAALGQHLRVALGKQLVIIATSSAKNGPGLPADATATGVDTVLGGVGISQFLLDLRHPAPAPAAAPWLAELQSMRANFTTHILVRLQDAFDAIVFFDQLTPVASASSR